jgi:hypothetical protein
MEFIHAPIHTPILEFEMTLYNGIMNLGRNPNVNVPLLELQGVKTANRSMFELDVDDSVKAYIATKGFDFELLSLPPNADELAKLFN